MSLVRLLTAGKSLVGLKDDQVRYRMTDPRAMPKFGAARNPFQPRAGAESAQSVRHVGQTSGLPVLACSASQKVAPSGAVGGKSLIRAKTGLVVEATGSSRSVSAADLPPGHGAGACEPRRVSEVCGLDNSDSLRKSDAPRLPDPEPTNTGATAPSKLASSRGSRSPSPQPSPQGEGEPAAALLQAGAQGQADVRSPSPWGEGRGEGDRRVPMPNAQRASKPVMAKAGGLKQWVSGFKALLGAGQLSPGRKPGPARSATQPVQAELHLDNVKVLRNDLSDTDLEIVTRASRSESRPAPPKAGSENSVPSETAWDRVATLFGTER